MKLSDLVHEYRRIAIIGLAKNVGKTTTLNYLLDELNMYRLGLTSIGYDGETVDQVTKTAKPRIYIPAGTIIATAKHCLLQSDFTMEIIQTTGIHTPLGEIIIAKALSAGYCLLSGPSIASQMREVLARLEQFGAEKCLIDGALSRKGMADPTISDATILATGASVGLTMDDCLKETLLTTALFSFPKYQGHVPLEVDLYPVVTLNEGGVHEGLAIRALESKELVAALKPNVTHVFVKGAITKSLVAALMTKELTLVIENPTKLFIDYNQLQHLKQGKLKIETLNQANLIAITLNPYSPTGVSFDPDMLMTLLKSQIELPIFNIRG